MICVKIELKDESIEHCVQIHRDYLYSYFKMYIQKEKFTKILAEISGSIGYGPLKKKYMLVPSDEICYYENNYWYLFK